jgi:hypothetical protein
MSRTSHRRCRDLEVIGSISTKSGLERDGRVDPRHAFSRLILRAAVDLGAVRPRLPGVGNPRSLFLGNMQRDPIGNVIHAELKT